VILHQELRPFTWDFGPALQHIQVFCSRVSLTPHIQEAIIENCFNDHIWRGAKVNDEYNIQV
jgi:hypothetical protein